MNAAAILANPNALELLNKVAALWGGRVQPMGGKLTERHVKAVLSDIEYYRESERALAILIGDGAQDWRPAETIAEDAYVL